jgi:hypothetical protein
MSHGRDGESSRSEVYAPFIYSMATLTSVIVLSMLLMHTLKSLHIIHEEREGRQPRLYAQSYARIKHVRRRSNCTYV